MHPPPPHPHSKAGTRRCNTAPSDGETPHSNAEQPQTPEGVSFLFVWFFFFHVRRCRSSSFLLKLIKGERALLQAESAAFKGKRRAVVPQHLRRTDGAHGVWNRAEQNALNTLWDGFDRCCSGVSPTEPDFRERTSGVHSAAILTEVKRFTFASKESTFLKRGFVL